MRIYKQKHNCLILNNNEIIGAHYYGIDIRNHHDWIARYFDEGGNQQIIREYTLAKLRHTIKEKTGIDIPMNLGFEQPLKTIWEQSSYLSREDDPTDELIDFPNKDYTAPINKNNLIPVFKNGNMEYHIYNNGLYIVHEKKFPKKYMLTYQSGKLDNLSEKEFKGEFRTIDDIIKIIEKGSIPLKKLLEQTTDETHLQEVINYFGLSDVKDKIKALKYRGEQTIPQKMYEKIINEINYSNPNLFSI